MSGMGERNSMTESDVREFASYLQAMAALPPAPDPDEPVEPGWYAQSPYSEVAYGYEPWLKVSEVEVAYLAPALMVMLTWTSSESEVERFMLVLDAGQMNAEKCIIRLEGFLSRERWFAGVHLIGTVRVVPVMRPSQ